LFKLGVTHDRMPAATVVSVDVKYLNISN